MKWRVQACVKTIPGTNAFEWVNAPLAPISEGMFWHRIKSVNALPCLTLEQREWVGRFNPTPERFVLVPKDVRFEFKKDMIEHIIRVAESTNT